MGSRGARGDSRASKSGERPTRLVRNHGQHYDSRTLSLLAKHMEDEKNVQQEIDAVTASAKQLRTIDDDAQAIAATPASNLSEETAMSFSSSTQVDPTQEVLVFCLPEGSLGCEFDAT